MEFNSGFKGLSHLTNFFICFFLGRHNGKCREAKGMSMDMGKAVVDHCIRKMWNTNLFNEQLILGDTLRRGDSLHVLRVAPC